MQTVAEILDRNDIRGVVLDIDDCLYLERDYVASGFAAVGRAVGSEAFGRFCWQSFEAGVRGNTFDIGRAKFSELKLPDTRELVEIYRQHKPKIQLCSDAKRFLEENQRPTSLITDGPLPSQRAKFDALELARYVPKPIFTAELGLSKPHIAPYLAANRQLSIDANKMVYIADNPIKDFKAPRALGWKTIRIRRNAGLHEAIDSGTDVDFEGVDFDNCARCRCR